MERERLLIDTSILIDYLRKQRKERAIFYRLSPEFDYVISSVTEFEFLVGATPRNRAFIHELLSKLPVLSFDSPCVKTAAEIYWDLRPRNQLISLPDIFIAATAITHNLKLLTLNRKHFERVQNLQIFSE